MLNYLLRFKKSKPSPHAEDASTPSSNAPGINELIHVAASLAMPPTIPSPSTPTPVAVAAAAVVTAIASTPTAAAATAEPDITALFVEVYDCAKNNHNWNKVSSVVSNHPDWLTRIPQGRRWTMLHQIVYCGNVTHLNEVLAYQISNQEFRLLCKALDDKTVREVAMERAHMHPQMLRRIERLVAIDQLLANAKDGKWELVRQFLRQQPDIINEKPPYKKYYLAHYLAFTGQLNMFVDLSHICQFKLDLKADNKTIDQIARENSHIQFAEYIENLLVDLNQSNQSNDQQEEGEVQEPPPPPPPPLPTADTEEPEHVSPPYPTTQPFFSQAFYNDPGIMIFSINSNSLGNMFATDEEPLTFLTSSQHHTSNGLHFATHSLLQGQYSTSSTYSNDVYPTTTAHSTAPESPRKSRVVGPPPMSDEEQVAYEKIVVENVKKFPADSLLNAVTCCITKAILRDPVVAADGFTYEREAIMNWFQHSSRSPMTNKELDSQELKPNHAIKSILQLLAETKTDEKTKIIHEKKK